jgi:hypothetical protein
VLPNSQPSLASGSVISGTSELGDYYAVGDSAWYYSFGYTKSNWMTYTMRGNGTYCEVWVENDLTFPTGDPRNSIPSKFAITDAMVDMIIDEFDNNIYATEAKYFGTPLPLNGTASYWNYIEDYSDSLNTTSDGRVMIMIMNIVDENFYDPSYPSYIAGFFSPTSDLYYDRNIIHIDCWDWANRTGPSSPRPFLYEGTVAHEYQHLLHDGLDPAEKSFINEGCSDYAEMLCGYGVPWGHIVDYLYTPSNSLTEWGDQGDINILADYGAAALFMIYLNDHFGGAKFVSTLAHDTDTGIDGVNSALASSGYSTWNFEKVFKYWKLANLIHSNTPGAGWYNYKSINLASSPVPVKTLNYYPGHGMVERSTYFGDIYAYNGYDTYCDTTTSYGVDYIKITGLAAYSNVRAKLAIDGDDISKTGWQNLGGYWYSTTGDMVDYKLRGTVDLTNETEAFLSFSTYWDTEELWDYCFLQVSTDGGDTWTSIADDTGYATYDSDPDAMQEIVDNLPGITGYLGYNVNLVYNLTDYVGQEVLVQFRYMSDPAVHYEGWYVWNVCLNGEVIDNAADIVTFAPVYPEVDFKVTLYAPMSYYRGMMLPAKIVDMSINDFNEKGSVLLTTYSKYQVLYVIVSPVGGFADYGFGVVTPVI